MQAKIIAVEQDGSRVIAVAQTPSGGKIRQPLKMDEIRKLCRVRVNDAYDAMKYLTLIQKTYIGRTIDMSGMFGGAKVKFG